MSTASITTTAQIAVDGATVHLTKINGKLVVSIDDPGCELAEVELIEHASGRSLAKVADPAAETQALEAIQPLLDVLKGRSSGVRSALYRATTGDHWEAYEALGAAAEAAGRRSYWSSITSRAGDAVAPSDVNAARTDWLPFLALAYRDLVGSYGYTAENYEVLTSGWRAVFGPVHPDDQLPAA